MESRPIQIHNSITKQEIFVLVLLSLVFVAQPFSFGGPRIPIFTLGVLGLWMLIRDSFLRNQVGIARLGVIFLLFVIPGLISFWNTYSVEKTMQFVLAMPASFCAASIIYSLLSNRRVMNILVAVIAVTSMIWVFDSIVQFISGKDLLGIPLMKFGRVTGPFQSSTHMGVLLTVTLPVTLKWLTPRGWFVQVLYLACLGVVLLLAGVRTDWITFLIAVALFYMCTNQGRVLLFLILIPMIILIAWVGISNSPIAQRKTNQLLNFPTTYKGWNKLTSKRLDIWMASWNMAMDHPITGVGSKSFNHAYKDYKVDTDRFKPVDGFGGAYHSHHPWFATLAETGFTGIVGLIGIIALMLGITRRSTLGLDFYHYPWLLTVVLIFNPVNSMPPLFKIWWFPIVVLAIAAHLVDLEYKGSSVVRNK